MAETKSKNKAASTDGGLCEPSRIEFHGRDSILI